MFGSTMNPKRRAYDRLTCLLPAFLLFILTGATAHPSSPGDRGLSGERTERTCLSACEKLQEHLLNTFHADYPDGYLAPEGDSLLFVYPLLATLSEAIYRQSGNKRFLSKAYSSASRYITYLFTNNDADGDGLLESRPAGAQGPAQGTIEDPGTNALVALDLLSLSRSSLKLGKPLESLFWYSEAGTIKRRLIEETYDPEANYFFPFDNLEQELKRRFYALSIIPVHFDLLLGENFAGSMVKNYLLKPQYLRPESPYHFLSWEQDGGSLEEQGPEILLKTALLLETLYSSDEKAREENLRIALTRKLAPSGIPPDGPSIAQPFSECLSCVLENGAYRDFFPRFPELKLFEELVLLKHLLDHREIGRLQRSLAAIKKALRDGRIPVGQETGNAEKRAQADSLLKQIRNVYFALSRIKEARRISPVFSQEDDNCFRGFDLSAAFSRLLEDVILRLRQAENLVFDLRSSESGFRLATTLLSERVAAGESLPVRFTLRTLKKPISIRSIIAASGQEIDTLLGPTSPVSISPADTSLSIVHHFSLRSFREDAVVPFRYSVTIEAEGCKIGRRNYFKGVYIEKPLVSEITFPYGRLLKGFNLPVEVTLRKNVPYGLLAGIAWYSPSGLKLKEGNSLEFHIPEYRDTAKVRLHVLVPDPCRPGAFPYLLKVFANGKDAGTFSRFLFKHYQWIFAGPFKAPKDPLQTEFPPEKRIDLLARYEGAGTKIGWRELPGEAYALDAAIALDRILPAGRVGYLYTVVKAAEEKVSRVSLFSNSPAALFINGEKVLTLGYARGPKTGEVEVHLKEGLNNILMKIVGRDTSRVFFTLGDDEDLASDELNNNLWELVDGFQDFHERSQREYKETSEIPRLVTFTYISREAHSVSVIGSFNGWAPENANMRRVSRDCWEITLRLSPGKYSYRFLINNHKHVLDPRCPFQESDGYGGKNSVLFVQ